MNIIRHLLYLVSLGLTIPALEKWRLQQAGVPQQAHIDELIDEGSGDEIGDQLEHEYGGSWRHLKHTSLYGELSTKLFTPFAERKDFRRGRGTVFIQ